MIADKISSRIKHADVFRAGADGVHTYRIPSLLVAPNGTLLAFCEARKESSGDATPTDMVLKRSTDCGRSWLPMQTVFRPGGKNAIMNPCPVPDGKTILLFCVNAHKSGREHHRQLLLHSEDNGQTWSDAADITENISGGDDTFVPGPGIGILTRKSRLVIPGYINGNTGDRAYSKTHSCAVYSDDGGKSWRLGEPVAFAGSNESQVVELADGSLMINCRIQNENTPGCRLTAISRNGGRDLGKTNSCARAQ